MRKTIKTIFAICVAICAMFAVSALAGAETVKGTATFDGSDMKLSLSDEQIKAALQSLQPGDNLTMSFDMVNNSSQLTDWYVQESVITAFEDNSNAAGGAFTYELSYTYPSGKKIIIKSSDGGGDATTGPVGLHQATSGTEKYFFLDTLKPKEKGVFSLHIALDGVTTGNTYMETLGKIRINFAVEEHKNGTTTVYNSGKSSSSKGLLTGDRGRFVIYMILLVVSLAVLFTVLGLQTRSRRKQ